MCDGFEIGGAHGGFPASLQPVCRRLFEQSRLGEMMRDSFRLRLHDFREALLEGVRDRGMQRGPAALENSRVGSIPHERMLEAVDRPGYLASAKYQFRADQLRKRLLKSLW